MDNDLRHRQVARWFTLLALVLIGGLLIYSMLPFTDAFLGAVILYVLSRPAMHRLVEKRKWRPSLAAILLILVSFLLVLVPVIAISYMIVPRITIFFGEHSMMMQLLQDASVRLKALTGFDLMTGENVQKLQAGATSFITGFLGTSINMLGEIAFMYILLYFLLVNYGKNESFLERNLPFSKEVRKQFSDELEAQTFSNAIGAPVLALVQGLSAILGYWVVGMEEPVFWGFMTGFFSFLPVAGSALIYVPASIYQFSVGNTWTGVGLLLYGTLVIGTVDNLFRFAFQKKFADVHPLITLVGVISGLTLFGVSGVIFGPLLISWFIILLRLVKQEYHF